jgi:thiol-disulfide isomerase/thioredoxin
VIDRVLYSVLVFAIVAGSVAVWKRPSRKLNATSRIDLGDLGIEGPAIVQFSTRYCAPCQVARPKLIAEASNAEITYAQIDLEERPDVMGRYGIRTAPTIVVAGPQGEILGRWTKLPEGNEISSAAQVAAASSLSA